MQMTKVWGNRFRKLQATGKDAFSYSEISDMFGIATANVAQKFKEIREIEPDAITEAETDDDTRRKMFQFDYDILLSEADDEPEPEPEFPDWMARGTYDSIMERLNLASGYWVAYERLDWERQYQRGGVRVVVYEDGQKAPEYERIYRLDNCVIVN